MSDDRLTMRGVQSGQERSLRRRIEVNREKAAKAKHEAIAAQREVRELRQKLNVKQEELDRLNIDWCPICDKKVKMEYDGEQEGYVYFCPFCGAKIYACLTCYFKNTDGETISEYHDRRNCYPGEGGCPYGEKRGVPRV